MKLDEKTKNELSRLYKMAKKVELEGHGSGWVDLAAFGWANVCRMILDAIRKFVFAFSQDCKNVQEMVLNSNRLFSHCFRKTKNQQLEIFVSC